LRDGIGDCAERFDISPFFPNHLSDVSLGDFNLINGKIVASDPLNHHLGRGVYHCRNHKPDQLFHVSPLNQSVHVSAAAIGLDDALSAGGEKCDGPKEWFVDLESLDTEQTEKDLYHVKMRIKQNMARPIAKYSSRITG